MTKNSPPQCHCHRSSSPDRTTHIAKKISITSFHNSTHCSFPHTTDSAEWARDLSAHVTSIMANSTPSTSPPTPQSSDQSQTPPLSETVTKWRANIPPGKSPPHHANRYATRPGPREGSTVAQDDDLLKAVRMYSLSERDAPGYFDFYPPELGTQQDLSGRRPQPDKQPSSHDQDKTLSLDPPPSLLIERLQDDVPMKTTIPKPGELPIMSTGQLPVKPDASSNTKPTLTARMRRPYRPGIFNIAFSFTIPSRRRASDVTPPISPRTCISSDACLPMATPDAPVKRQRIDASTSPPPLQATPTARAASLGMPPFAVFDSGTGSSQWWSSSDPLKLNDPKHIRAIPTHTEPHPGKLIDFSVANKSLEAIRQQRAMEEDSDTDEEEYHNHLDSSQRRYYSPSPHHTRILFNIGIDSKDNTSLQRHCKETSGKEPRILCLSSPPTVSCLRRASSLPHPPQSGPPSTSTSGPSSSSSSTLLPRTPNTRTPSVCSDPGVSNPAVSVDRFLMHIRASQEARAVKLRQQVFRDDEMRGWLGDEPL